MVHEQMVSKLHTYMACPPSKLPRVIHSILLMDFMDNKHIPLVILGMNWIQVHQLYLDFLKAWIAPHLYLACP